LEWVERNITNPTDELVLLRKIIPWEKIVKQLSQFYNKLKGRTGKSLRIMAGLMILSRLRLLSDDNLVKQVKQNRYYQYFCNVPDKDLAVFMNPSSICKIRQRFGKKGAAIIETSVFNMLRRAGVIDADNALIDSSVLESNIVYPTDVKLIYKAFCKMVLFARHNGISLWWDHSAIKAIWREYNLDREKNSSMYLFELATIFHDALTVFELQVNILQISKDKKKKALQLLDILKLLDEQNHMKIRGEKHIENRIVSLDEPEARPIKKGKTHPKCEFGTTFQATFNRQGFMITVENFIGKPSDKTLYLDTLELFKKRMKTYPKTVVTDLGYRSNYNFRISKDKVKNIFLGRSDDVDEKERDFSHKARSATEGFMAVAKNWHGFKRSLYKGFSGDKIWSSLCQWP
jgi:IS5 family transposase